jgi:hypothetical protein
MRKKRNLETAMVRKLKSGGYRLYSRKIGLINAIEEYNSIVETSETSKSSRTNPGQLSIPTGNGATPMSVVGGSCQFRNISGMSGTGHLEVTSSSANSSGQEHEMTGEPRVGMEL